MDKYRSAMRAMLNRAGRSQDSHVQGDDRDDAPVRRTAPEQQGPRRVMDVTVAGSFYRLDDETRAALAEGVALGWRREPENTHDSNAVALVLPGDPERMIGYIPARVAARLAPHLDRGCGLAVQVTGVPLGMRDSTITVRLDLDLEVAGAGRGEEIAA